MLKRFTVGRFVVAETNSVKTVLKLFCFSFVSIVWTAEHRPYQSHDTFQYNPQETGSDGYKTRYTLVIFTLLQDAREWLRTGCYDNRTGAPPYTTYVSGGGTWG